jgi:hypothetical protein
MLLWWWWWWEVDVRAEVTRWTTKSGGSRKRGGFFALSEAEKRSGKIVDVAARAWRNHLRTENGRAKRGCVSESFRSTEVSEKLAPKRERKNLHSRSTPRAFRTSVDASDSNLSSTVVNLDI